MSNQLTPQDRVADRAALCAFLSRLRAEYDESGAEWENRTLDAFLEALEAWISSAPGWYANHKQVLPAEGYWTFFARALTAARHYE